jgi:2-polyprenyl-3-methyl-5-hydroxy-6-metoxy-1,4-benzoquinol methylase
MTQISKRLEQIVRRELSHTIIPVKTDEGILVGSVLIINQGNLKSIKRNGEILYRDINLNKAAIAIANLLARYRSNPLADQIYAADRDYGKWITDSHIMRSSYEKSVKNKDFERADITWARYQESRSRAADLKNKVENLSNI